jgi:tripartite-type tricarboxylate transporter receptor subunit TctC
MCNLSCVFRVFVVTAFASLLPLTTSAQGTWPERPIRLVVPFAPGASTDNVARMVALKLSPRLGQSVVVDNRGGAGGVMGIDAVVKAQPDGHTLLFASSTVITSAALEGKNLPYDPLKDLTPIGEAGSVPFMIVVPEMVKVSTLADFIALARAKPRGMSYGTGGVGTITHLATELFASAAKIELLHVPYKGVGAALPDFLAGRLQVLLPTGTQRSPLAPDLTTAAEAGLTGFQVEAWWGVLGPARLPMPRVQRLSNELNAVVVSPDFRELLTREGATARAGTPEAFGKHMQSELARWSRLIKDANIQGQR